MVPKTVAAQSASAVSETNEVITRLTATEIEITRTKNNLRKDIGTHLLTRSPTNDKTKFPVENIVSEVYQSIIVEYTTKFTEIEKQLKSMKSHLGSLDD